MLKAERKRLGIRATEGQRKDQTRKYGSLDQISDHHIKRYEFALGKIPEGSKVIDAACGCGYGSYLIHKAGFDVTGVDISEEAIAYAERYYPGPKYVCKDAREVEGDWDVLVSIETLEHLASPKDLLEAVKAPILIASVPNENVYPFSPELFKDDVYPHQRHYTPEQFEELLDGAGYKVVGRYSQANKIDCDVLPGDGGRFLVYCCGLK